MDLNADQERGRLKAQEAITLYRQGDLEAVANIVYDVTTEQNADLLASFHRYTLEILDGVLGVVEEQVGIDATGLLQDLFLSMDSASE